MVPIVGISFCWDTPPHPDPRGKQLRTVASMLKQERPKYAKLGFTDMGVFWDVRIHNTKSAFSACSEVCAWRSG